MTDFLSKHDLCAKVLIYIQDEHKDFLVTEQIVGSDAASLEYLEAPQHLCDIFTESLLLDCIG